jgi:hypothetical protein
VRRLVCDLRHRFGIPALRNDDEQNAKATPTHRFDTDPLEIKRAIEEGACARQGLGADPNCP